MVGAVVGGGVEAYLEYRSGNLHFSLASAGKIAITAGAGAATGGVGTLLEVAGAGTVATIGITTFYGSTTSSTAYVVNSCAIDRSCSGGGLAIAAGAGALNAGGGGALADVVARLAGRSLGTIAGAITKGAIGSGASAGVGIEADNLNQQIDAQANQVNSQAQGKVGK